MRATRGEPRWLAGWLASSHDERALEMLGKVEMFVLNAFSRTITLICCIVVKSFLHLLSTAYEEI